MPVSAAERDYLLAQVDRLAQTDLNNLWRQAESLSNVDFFGYVSAAFPEVVDVYHQTAGQLAATWFEESNPASSYVAQVVEPLARQQLVSSVQWALGADGEQAVSRMSGTMQRAVYGGARDTVVLNAEVTGSRWLRVARPTACEFCRMLATRTGNYAYTSKAAAEGVVGMKARNRRKGARKLGEKYHDHCHCQAVEIRDTQTVDEVLNDQQRKLFRQWNDEYDKARANAGTTETKKLLSTWRQQNKVIVQTSAPNPLDRKILDSAKTPQQAADYIRAKHGIKVDQLIDSPLSNGIPIDESVANGVDIITAATAAKTRTIDARTAREFGQAVDDVLAKYPFLELDEINAEFYTPRNPLLSEAHATPKIGPDGKPIGGAKVSINGLVDFDDNGPGSAYKRRRKSVSRAAYDNKYKAEEEKRPVYAVMVHEMGHVVDFNSGGTAQTRAAEALRQHIISLPEAQKIKELPKIVEFAKRSNTSVDDVFTYSTEYQDFEKQWLRDNLVSAYSFKNSNRDEGVYLTEALAEAFADVELRGDKAETASKIIHKAMTDAARDFKAAK